jgi:hypothetical protein
MDGLRGVAVSLTLVVPLGLVLGLSWAKAATPSTAADVGELVHPRAEPAYGLTYEARAARFSHDLYSRLIPIDPVADQTGEVCGHGLEGSVYLVPPSWEIGERTCTVPTGMALLIPLLHGSSSTVAHLPILARNGADLRVCTDAQFPRPAQLTTLIDGVAVPALERHRVQPDLLSVAFAKDNWIEVAPAVLEGIAGGPWLLLGPLPPGAHELRFTASLPHIGVFHVVTLHLIVVEPVVVEHRVGGLGIRPSI